MVGPGSKASHASHATLLALVRGFPHAVEVVILVAVVILDQVRPVGLIRLGSTDLNRVPTSVPPISWVCPGTLGTPFPLFLGLAQTVVVVLLRAGCDQTPLTPVHLSYLSLNTPS